MSERSTISTSVLSGLAVVLIVAGGLQYRDVVTLGYAVERGDHSEVTRILSTGANPDTPDESGYTPLMQASQSGQIEVAKLLLNHGANVNARATLTRITPLLRAIESGNLSLVKLLIQHGANPNLTDSHLEGPLLKAVRAGNEDIAEYLIAQQASCKQRNLGGVTPFEDAKRSRDKRMMELLKRHRCY